MSSISPALLRETYKLTAGFYEAGIDCPPLVDLNRWMLSQQMAVGSEGAASYAPPAGSADFQTALTDALKSSPRGVDIPDLRAILTKYERSGAQIGAALGRMAKAGTAHKVGELWFGTPAKTARVDRTLVTGRGRAKTPRETPAARAAAEAEPQPAAA